MEQTVAFYKENASILRDTFTAMGFSVYGGEDAPYVWVRPESGHYFGTMMATCFLFKRCVHRKSSPDSQYMLRVPA